MSKQTQAVVLECLLAAQVGSAAEVVERPLRWEKLAPVPSTAGLGSPYAGVSEGALLVAGGANFPDAPPWAGGKKRWYDTVYALSEPQGRWREVGKLIRPMGYGVSVTAPGGVVCAGGSDLTRHYRDVFLLRLAGGVLETKPLPPLPRPMANGCGAVMGSVLYVAGGIEEPGSTNTLQTFWSLDTAAAKPAWRELEPWPGPSRMLSVAAVHEGAFYLIGGTSLSGDAEGKPVRHYLTDAYSYHPGSGWKRLADMPRPAVAAPSPAPVLDNSRILVLSGDDGTKVNFQPLDQHPGFAKDVLAYDTASNTWAKAGEVPLTQVTVPAVAWRGRHVIPNGEIRPGVRTPEVWSLRLRAAEKVVPGTNGAGMPPALPYSDSKKVGAGDFYFAINATFRFIHKQFGQAGLQRYWQELGATYYAPVTAAWKAGGLPAVGKYWRAFFDAEPGAGVRVDVAADRVMLKVRICPAIKHLRAQGREILPCFCQHCYYVAEAMAAPAGLTVRVEGGNGACRQTFLPREAEVPPQDLGRIKEAA